MPCPHCHETGSLEIIRQLPDSRIEVFCNSCGKDSIVTRTPLDEEDV